MMHRLSKVNFFASKVKCTFYVNVVILAPGNVNLQVPNLHVQSIIIRQNKGNKKAHTYTCELFCVSNIGKRLISVCFGSHHFDG